MEVIRPGVVPHEEPRGVVGGHEVSRATTGSESLFMGIFRLPAGAGPRPPLPARCAAAGSMLSGGMRIRGGERLEHVVELQKGDMLWVPPQETHVLENL